MDITNALIRLRNDLKEWVTNNLIDLRASIPSKLSDLEDDKKEPTLSLGVYNNLIYIFKDGKPVGSGIKINNSSNNDDNDDGTTTEPDSPPEVVNNVLTTGEVYLNKRYSGSSSALADDGTGMFALIFPVKKNTHYKLIFNNLKISLTSTTDNTMYLIDENKANSVIVNGGKNFANMTSGVTLYDNGLDGEVEFDTNSNSSYVAISLRVATPAITQDDIADYVIILEEGDTVNIGSMTYPEGSELYLNERYSQSGGGLTTDNSDGCIALIMPIDDPLASYTLSISNMPSTALNTAGSTLYRLDKDKNCLGNVNGSNYPYTMTSGITISSDYKSATIEFVPTQDTKYMAFTTRVANSRISEDVIKDIVVTLEKGPSKSITYPEGSELYLKKAFSQSGGGIIDDNYKYLIDIPVDNNSKYNISINAPNVDFSSDNGSTIYLVNSDNTEIDIINGSKFFYEMATGVSITNNGHNVELNIITLPTTTHIVLSIALSRSAVSEAAIADHVIEIEKVADSDSGSIIYPEGSELYINKRFSQSENKIVDGTGMFLLFIPIENDNLKYYSLEIKNSQINLASAASSTLYTVDENKLNAIKINGGSIPEMDKVLADDGTYKIEFVANKSMKFIALSLRASDSTISELFISNYVIALNPLDKEIITSEPLEITENVTWTADTRLSSSNGSYKTETGAYASNDISCKLGDTIRIYGVTPTNYAYVIPFNGESFISVIDATLSSLVSNNELIVESNSNVLTITVVSGNVTKIRLCNKGNMVPENIRVSINKEI